MLAPAPVRSERAQCRALRSAIALAAALASSCANNAFDWQGRSPSQLEEYRQAFQDRAGTRFIAAASREQFLTLAKTKAALFLGDHHRDADVHAEQRALLRDLVGHGARVQLLLEAIAVEDQIRIDDYLRGEMSMERLVAECRARWPEAWIAGGDVDPEHWRGMLRIAKELRIPVHGLEPAPRLPLTERDARIAAQARTIALANEGSLVVVIVGQSHLLGPGRVVERTGLPCTVVGAALPKPLARIEAMRPDADVARTDQGVWFFASSGRLR